MDYHGFFVILQTDGDNSVQDILEISRRYALILYVRSLRNFKTKETREVVMVLTHMRGAVIPTSVSKGFLRVVHKEVVRTVPRFVIYNKTLIRYG